MTEFSTPTTIEAIFNPQQVRTLRRRISNQLLRKESTTIKLPNEIGLQALVAFITSIIHDQQKNPSLDIRQVIPITPEKLATTIDNIKQETPFLWEYKPQCDTAYVLDVRGPQPDQIPENFTPDQLLALNQLAKYTPLFILLPENYNPDNQPQTRQFHRAVSKHSEHIDTTT